MHLEIEEYLINTLSLLHTQVSATTVAILRDVPTKDILQKF
jgi:hypothetical protein